MMRSATLDAAPSIELRAIERSYGARQVLAGVSLERSTPGIIGLQGANGVGKTTLLRVIAQLVEPDSGTVCVCGRQIERADDEDARRVVGWAPHEPLAWRDDSVLRNLTYAARLAGLRRREAQVLARSAVSAWQLQHVADEPVRRLSRGWAQRYSLARADLLSPQVLLLDEPTTGLDTQARTMLEEALERWRETRIVIVASHERDWLAARCDELLDLDDASPAAQVTK